MAALTAVIALELLHQVGGGLASEASTSSVLFMFLSSFGCKRPERLFRTNNFVTKIMPN